MFGSSESWGPQQHPHPWHFRAGGGAVHSIKSGHMRCSKPRATVPTHTQPNKLRRTAVLPLLERDREQFIQRRLLERRLRTIIPGPISRGNGRFRVHHCLPNCLKASARLKAQGPRTFATTSSERDDGFCKMTPKRHLGQHRFHRMDIRAPRCLNMGAISHGGTIMKKLSMLGIVGGAALLAAVPFSLQWSQGNVGPAVPLLTLSHANAQYYGPYRRHVRRVYRRAYRRAYGGHPYSYGGYPSCLGQYPC